MYEYRATLRRVIDGDTVEVDADLGFSVSVRSGLRLRGINTPELRARDPLERVRAVAARQYLMDRLPRTEHCLVVRTFKDASDKYGRMLADVFVDGAHVNAEMIEQGHAVPYMV